MSSDPRFDALRGFFRIGMFIGFCGLVMALVEPRHSAEFVLSVCSALMGGALILGVLIITRLMR
jgi:hypothetical protein